jgi:hypothetical protein
LNDVAGSLVELFLFFLPIAKTDDASMSGLLIASTGPSFLFLGKSLMVSLLPRQTLVVGVVFLFFGGFELVRNMPALPGLH